MEGLLGKYTLGNLEDMKNPDVRDSMPYSCDSVRRLELDITASTMLSFLDLPLVDAHGNTYRVELASPNPRYTGNIS